MNSVTINKMKSNNVLTSISIIILVAMLSPRALGYSDAMRKGHLKGPWEILIMTGQESQKVGFPVIISDENKPEKLDVSYPVMGTPIEVRLEQYIPDLKWEYSIAEQDGAGAVAAIKIKGAANTPQEMLLNSTDPERQSLSSSIGGVAIKKLYNANTLNQLTQKFKNGKTVGVVSVWLEGSKEPVEFLVNLKESISIPGTKYKFEILKYLPHYSVDTDTKEVTNQSESPFNPAVKIKLEDGENSYDQWVWSKFPSSPHSKVKLPLRVEFTEIDLGSEPGYYVIIAAPNTDPVILFKEDKKIAIKKVEFEKDYPFTRERYSFSIEKVVANAAIKESWTNSSEKLSNPALVLSLVYNDSKQEVVLELSTPFQKKTDFGMITILYKKQKPHGQMGMGG